MSASSENGQDDVSSKLFAGLRIKGEGDEGRPAQSVEELVDTFLPGSTWRSRTAATLSLAGRYTSDQRSYDGLANRVREYLQTGTVAESFAALRLMSSFFTVAPEKASRMLFDVGLLSIALHKASVQWPVESIVSLALAELLCTASSHPSSRQRLLKIGNAEEPKSESKIVELSNDEVVQQQSQNPLAWLVALEERTEIEDPSAENVLLKIGLIATLTLYKLTRLGQKPDKQLTGVVPTSSDRSKDGDAGKHAKQAEEAALLFELCKRQLLSFEHRIAHSDAADPKLEESSERELQRFASMSALEGLSYLVMEQSVYRDRIADDQALLKAIHTLSRRASSAKDIGLRYAFPRRDFEAADRSMVVDRTVDTAMQFALVSLFSAVAAPRPVKSKEETQMAKLRRMANAVAQEDPDETDDRLNKRSVEHRVNKLVDADIVEVLSFTALSSASTGMNAGVNPSSGVRQALGRTLCYFTAPQDKRMRGKIIKQGGAKALLALSNADVSEIVDAAGKANVATPKPENLLAIQALAQLLITEDPAIIFASPIEVVRPLALLYMHGAASLLQQFEAALALTNVASISPELAQRVARCSFVSGIQEGSSDNMFVGADRAAAGDVASKAARTALSDLLRQRILLEDNEMSRRASLELLCNLLVVDEVFAQWSGESEDSSGVDAKEIDKPSMDEGGRASKDMIILIALCGPAGDGHGVQESGLKTRLAASAVVATLCGSASACARVLALGPATIAKICRLFWPEHEEKITEIHESTDVDEQDDLVQLHKQDLNSDPLGAGNAQAQLSLRGLTAIECLVDFVLWLRGQGTNDTTKAKQVIRQSGAPQAVKLFLKQEAQRLKTSPSNVGAATIQQASSVQLQVTKQAVTILQKMQTLNVLDS